MADRADPHYHPETRHLFGRPTHLSNMPWDIHAMCSRYEPPTSSALENAFGVDLTYEQGDLWPGYSGPILRIEEDAGGASRFTGSVAKFGLLPHWAKDEKLARSTFNARSETAAQKPSFRSAWAKSQHCIIPAQAIYEPDWRSGKAVPTRITRKDGGLLCIAGLWDSRTGPDGNEQLSFTMLTINAEDHDLMKNFHRPGKEKRMIVILPSSSVEPWLMATPDQSPGFFLPYPSERLVAEAAK